MCVDMHSVRIQLFGNDAINNCHSDVIIYSRHNNSVIPCYLIQWKMAYEKERPGNLVETPGSVSFRVFEGKGCKLLCLDHHA